MNHCISSSISLIESWDPTDGWTSPLSYRWELNGPSLSQVLPRTVRPLPARLRAGQDFCQYKLCKVQVEFSSSQYLPKGSLHEGPVMLRTWTWVLSVSCRRLTVRLSGQTRFWKSIRNPRDSQTVKIQRWEGWDSRLREGSIYFSSTT